MDVERQITLENAVFGFDVQHLDVYFVFVRNDARQLTDDTHFVHAGHFEVSQERHGFVCSPFGRDDVVAVAAL